MLPSIVRMIPVEVHHVIRLEIKRLIPEALQKRVIDQPLNVMSPGRYPERLDRTVQRDPRIQPAQLSSELGNAFASRVAFLGRKLGELRAKMRIAELPRRTHFSVEIEKELAAGFHLSIKGAHGCPGIRGV